MTAWGKTVANMIFQSKMQERQERQFQAQRDAQATAMGEEKLFRELQHQDASRQAEDKLALEKIKEKNRYMGVLGKKSGYTDPTAEETAPEQEMSELGFLQGQASLARPGNVRDRMAEIRLQGQEQRKTSASRWGTDKPGFEGKKTLEVKLRESHKQQEMQGRQDHLLRLAARLKQKQAEIDLSGDYTKSREYRQMQIVGQLAGKLNFMHPEAPQAKVLMKLLTDKLDMDESGIPESGNFKMQLNAVMQNIQNTPELAANPEVMQLLQQMIPGAQVGGTVPPAGMVDPDSIQ